MIKGSRGRLIAIAAVACGMALGVAPGAMAQSPVPVPPLPVDPQQAVDTISNAITKEWTGGITAHSYQCDESRPEVQTIVNGVKKSLSNSFPNITTMLVRGYMPYADAPLFGLSGREGHWINPGFIGDGHIMDPEKPESILVDKWNRPIGVMFIEDAPGTPGPDMYVGDWTDPKTGTTYHNVPCNGWHYHGEALADAYWYAYKYGYSGDVEKGDLQPPDRTPDLMHVWAYGASKCDATAQHPDPFVYEFQHAVPPQELMPGDPQSADDAHKIVGGPRGPVDPADHYGSGMCY